jgi:antitoxin component YwqK of YwqJK toxin-antitoxin module
MMSKATPEPHIQYHRDGSIWARGQHLDGLATGYWEWFRKDGVRMRSGHFDQGEQIGEWTTYDKNGDVYKVTTFKPKVPAKTAR